MAQKPKKVKVLAPKEFKVVEDKYVLTIKLGNETYTSKGEIMLEAVTAMQLPRKVITKGLLTVTHGEKKGEKMLMPLFLRRIFYPLARFHKAKQLELWLK